MIFKIILTALIITMFIGCVPKAPIASYQVQKEFQKIEADKNIAILYIGRDDTFRAGGVSLDYYIDAKKAGHLGNQDAYYAILLSPGEHKIRLERGNNYIITLNKGERKIIKDELVTLYQNNGLEPKLFTKNKIRHSKFLGYKDFRLRIKNKIIDLENKIYRF